MTDNNNNQVLLSEMEKDVIGEVMNISMGSAATAMSTILDKKVNITTPRIGAYKTEEFEFSYLEPVVGVMIKYIEGISGSNMLILKEDDMKKILRHLLSIEEEEEVEFDEISESAICEIMNQMMGSAASALASFLGIPVNISTPELINTAHKDDIQKLFSVQADHVISIKFNISIDGIVDSEFISVMEPQLAKEIVGMSLGTSEEEQEAVSEEKLKVTSNEQVESSQTTIQEVTIPAQTDNVKATIKNNQSQQVEAVPYTYKQIGEEESKINGNKNNYDLIMSVPIQLTVELGRTRKKIKDIADFTVGNIVELDRQAGDQVDIIANGKLIAKGDVVVVDDYYSVRISEIMKARDSFTDIE